MVVCIEGWVYVKGVSISIVDGRGINGVIILKYASGGHASHLAVPNEKCHGTWCQIRRQLQWHVPSATVTWLVCINFLKLIFFFSYF